MSLQSLFSDVYKWSPCHFPFKLKYQTRRDTSIIIGLLDASKVLFAEKRKFMCSKHSVRGGDIPLLEQKAHRSELHCIFDSS